MQPTSRISKGHLRGVCNVYCLLLALVCARPLHAAEGAGPTQVLNLPPAAFGAAHNEAHFVIEEGGLGRLCSIQGAAYFVAPLLLEDGAVIERVSAFVQDKSKESFALISVVRRTPEESELLAISPVSSGGRDLETLSTGPIAAPVIDNQHYSYLLQVVLTGPKVCLSGAQVAYRKPLTPHQDASEK
jgi:hypothetical protein